MTLPLIGPFTALVPRPTPALRSDQAPVPLPALVVQVGQHVVLRRDASITDTVAEILGNAPQQRVRLERGQIWPMKLFQTRWQEAE